MQVLQKEKEIKFEQEKPIEISIGFKCDRENRICDETTYMISALQEKLDASKIANHKAIQTLADKIEH